MPTVRRSAALLALAVAAGCAAAPAATVPVPEALKTEGVPAAPAALAAEVGKYNDFRPVAFDDWHPVRREMVVTRRVGDTPQLLRLPAPGAAPEVLTREAEPIHGAGYRPVTGDYLLLSKDTGGDEVFRAWRMAPTGGAMVPVTPAGKRVQGMAFTRDGKQLAYAVVPVGRHGSADQVATELFVADPLRPEAARKVAELPGGAWGGFDFSPDGKSLLCVERRSANEARLWTIDLASGARRRLAGDEGGPPMAVGFARFDLEGRGIYLCCDRGREFLTLAWMDLASGATTWLSADVPWNVESADLSEDGRRLAVLFNADGRHELRILDTLARRWLDLPAMPPGQIGAARWHRNGRDLAFTVSSSASPSDIWSFDADTCALTRWTRPAPAQVDTSAFAEPELVRWPSFDGRVISGFLYRAPAAKFPGKRPVLVVVHGGPEGQSKPGFLGRANYYLNELGVSILMPNVRGSTGYGKTFLALDDGLRREDSVKDIGALFDWIAARPDLDASKVVVRGGSYGGYMALAVACTYPDRIAGAIDSVGISHFATFLERTESYRRDLRRVEYGDERDPAMRAWMDKIAPLNRAADIKKPLFVVQGRNDPRVPWQEADQIVRTVRAHGTPVWYMLAENEGHGFRKKANADQEFYATIAFLRWTLLGREPAPAARRPAQ